VSKVGAGASAPSPTSGRSSEARSVDRA